MKSYIVELGLNTFVTVETEDEEAAMEMAKASVDEALEKVCYTYAFTNTGVYPVIIEEAKKKCSQAIESK